MKYGLTKKEIALINGVFVATQSVKCVFIYGSRVKNIFVRASDIDLAVVFQQGAKNELGNLKADLDDLPIIYEIDSIDESKMRPGSFKDEYERTKETFYTRVS